MKYYKLIKQTDSDGWKENNGTAMKKGRIVYDSEIFNSHPFSFWYSNQEKYWQEVSEEEYNLQEGIKWKLPEKWCIKDTAGREVLEYFSTYSGSTCKMYTGSTNGYLHCPAVDYASLHSNKQSGYTEITLEQFKKYVLKEKEMKAQSFTIKSSSSGLLKAWFEEAEKFEYSLVAMADKTFANKELFSNNTDNPTLANYKKLTNYISRKSTTEVEFTLPQQYEEALQFVKDQLDPKYWVVENEFKVGDWVVFTANGGYMTNATKTQPVLNEAVQIMGLNKPFMSEGDCNATMSNGLFMRLSTVDKRGENPYPKFFRKATPAEIKKAQQSDIEISGYKLKQSGGNLIFGCKTIPNKIVKSFFNSLDDLRDYGVTIDLLVEKIGTTGLTPEKIAKIKQLL